MKEFLKRRKRLIIGLGGFLVGFLVALGVILAIVNAKGEMEEGASEIAVNTEVEEVEEELETEELEEAVVEEVAEENPATPVKICSNENFTLGWGRLMLINPNFTVSTDWIAARRTQLVNITELYGIREGNSYNGVPLMDAEAAEHLNTMLADYRAEYPGHEMTTRSCFRSRGTNCGRLCLVTGTSDHHTGYTCDLIDDAYGNSLDTDTYAEHLEWQWLHENSYKYGFIDRFVENWAGGPMSELMNVNAEGTTGLFETWHYRYVGVEAATEIRNGKYNGGIYDSLEHYLKATGRIRDLTAPAGNC